MLSELIRDRGTAAPASCEAMADLLPGVVDGTSKLDRTDRRHVERCLRCQAELAQYRKLLRAMQALRTSPMAVPTGLVTEVIATLEAAGERSAVRATLTGRKVAYIGGIAAAATAAGAGAAIVLVSRGRKGRLPLAG
ncbi:anti-sigma factor family protein [Aquihabitans sp. McL0605]|uniref:anti-sigma factor family protein n=1 Tax=Aquihabitans sp. McL0605 TaxID=3415671 RepID=UPI003CF05B98